MLITINSMINPTALLCLILMALMAGSRSMIPKTAQNDNWNPRSESNEGFKTNMIKAELKTIFRLRAFIPYILANPYMLNIIPALVTLGVAPVTRTYNHRANRLIRTFSFRFCLPGISFKR